jgi:hypothetical protein
MGKLEVIQGTFRKHSGNIQGTFRERSGNVQGTCREHSGNIQGTFREQSGNTQVTFRECSGNVEIEANLCGEWNIQIVDKHMVRLNDQKMFVFPRLGSTEKLQQRGAAVRYRILAPNIAVGMGGRDADRWNLDHQLIVGRAVEKPCESCSDTQMSLIYIEYV